MLLQRRVGLVVYGETLASCIPKKGNISHVALAAENVHHPGMSASGVGWWTSTRLRAMWHHSGLPCWGGGVPIGAKPLHGVAGQSRRVITSVVPYKLCDRRRERLGC